MTAVKLTIDYDNEAKVWFVKTSDLPDIETIRAQSIKVMPAAHNGQKAGQYRLGLPNWKQLRSGPNVNWGQDRATPNLHQSSKPDSQGAQAKIVSGGHFQAGGDEGGSAPDRARSPD